MVKRIAPDAAKARAQQMKEKSIRMSYMADFSELTGIMKANLEYAPRVLAYAQKLILHKDPNGEKTEEPPEPGCEGQGHSESSGSAGSGVVRPMLCDAGDSGVAHRSIDRRSTTLEGLPVKDLTTIVVSLEKVSLSVFALRALVRRGAREATTTALCEILEFACNLDPRSKLDRDRFDTIDDLIGHVKELYAACGHRAKDLEMPPDWDRQGVYQFEQRLGLVIVVNRFTGLKAHLPEHMQGQDFGAYRFEDNFSEHRAKAIVGTHKEVCMMLLPRRKPAFPEQELSTPTPGKRIIDRATMPPALRIRSAASDDAGSTAETPDKRPGRGAPPSPTYESSLGDGRTTSVGSHLSAPTGPSSLVGVAQPHTPLGPAPPTPVAAAPPTPPALLAQHYAAMAANELGFQPPPPPLADSTPGGNMSEVGAAPANSDE